MHANINYSIFKSYYMYENNPQFACFLNFVIVRYFIACGNSSWKFE